MRVFILGLLRFNDFTVGKNYFVAKKAPCFECFPFAKGTYIGLYSTHISGLSLKKF